MNNIEDGISAQPLHTPVPTETDPRVHNDSDHSVGSSLFLCLFCLALRPNGISGGHCDPHSHSVLIFIIEN